MTFNTKNRELSKPDHKENKTLQWETEFKRIHSWASRYRPDQI